MAVVKKHENERKLRTALYDLGSVNVAVECALGPKTVRMEEENRCIRIAAVSSPPLVTVAEGGPPYVITGIMKELFPMLMAYLNRCYEWVVPEPRLYGHKLPNGSWQGVIGLVARGEADISVPLSITTERLTAIDFTEPVFIDEFAIAYKLPSLKSDIKGFIKPFSPTVRSVARDALCCHLRLCLDVAHPPLTRRPRPPPSSSVPPHSLRDGSPSPAVSWEPTGYAPRIVGGLWLLVAFILGVVYRGNLKAMLILPNLELPFNNLEELAESDAPIWSPGSHVAHQLLMAAPPHSLYGALARKTFVALDIPAGTIETLKGKHAVFALMSGFTAIVDDFFSTVNL
ncbi:glutamate receptor ionotropic, delta-1-like [Penaeus monodon]|uniref:glutamate receptor ionotropic, delta-1-like n=1 Tax=Penaeus monodon TaxID=6687 RepID=UPI0018A7A657|nr:glutamate receptor ionotropic, delta-1-like [Penaeus monodon]